MLLELLYPKFLQFMQLYGFETTIIPISMLGFSAGSLYIFRRKITPGVLCILSLFFSLFTVAVPFLLMYINYKLLAILLIALPFFFSSAIITSGYLIFSPFLIYTSVSVGSATGVLFVVLFLGRVSGENLLFLSATIMALTSILVSEPGIKRKIYYLITAFLFLIIFIINTLTDSLNFIKIMPPSKRRFVNYAGSDRLKEKDVELLSSKWSLIARVDLIKENLSIYDSLFGDDIMNFQNSDVRKTFLDLKGQGDFYNLYYNNVIFTFIPYRDKITWKMPPYTLLKNPSVLIIGLGGGVDIAIARYNNAKKIVAVEINPAMVSLMMNNNTIPVNTYKFADVHLMDGRSFVECSKERFDLIQLMFTELYVPFPNSLAFVENYLYTVEAFRTYLKRLNDNGIIFVNKWVGNYETPTELLRITTTAYEAMKLMNIRNPENNIVIVGYFISGWKTNGGYILIKKNPFTHEEITKIKESLGEPMYLLYSPEDKTLNNPFAAFFRTSDVRQFYEIAPYDISPTYDDRPYLNQFDKKLTAHRDLLKNLIFISSLLLFYIFFNIRKNFLRFIHVFTATIFIAVAYMWIELIIVQKFNILLGSPIVSMGITMVSFFVANGLGSMVMSKRNKINRTLMLISVPLIVLIIFKYLPEVVPFLLDKPQIYKVLSCIFVSLLSGFFLGMPFPVLIDIMNNMRAMEEIPLLISFDGIFSVLAVGFIMFFSVIYGFNLLLFISAILCIPGILLVLLLLK